jgi:hypothetical protein
MDTILNWYLLGRNIIIILIMAAMVLSACANAPKAGIQAESADMAVSESSIDGRMITYSVSLRLSVKNIENTQETLIAQTKNYNGFIVRESENYLTARVPVVNMDDFVNSAKVLGTVEDETKTGTDITNQYRDNTVRLASLKNVQGRYLSLLEKANTVNDILNIEKELERINTEIEIDLFDNPVGCFTSLAVFQAKALQNCGFSGSCSETEVSEQL